MTLISPKLTNYNDLDIHCSCSSCDSVSCFVKRNLKDAAICDCYECTNTTCLFYKNHVETKNSLDANTTQEKNSEVLRKEIKLKYDRETNTDNKQTERKILINKIKDEFNDLNKARKYVSKLSITYSKREINSNTAKLAAEIMNLPVKDIEKEPKESSLSSIPKLPKFDVLKTLKEAYEACSCKICNCVTGTFATNSCKCKPCDCKDCKNLDGDKPIGCPCIRCNRSQCKGIANRFNEDKICDCRPCDCIGYTENIPKSCNCEPCQCFDCEKLKSQIGITPNDEYMTCKCSPCDCINCKSIRRSTKDISTNTDKSSQFDEESSIINSFDMTDENDCKCSRRNRITDKPFKKSTREYDIRSIRISDHRVPVFDTSKNVEAPFEFFPNTKLKSSENQCECNECECITCICKESIANGIKASKLFKCPKKQNSFDSFTECNCTACECEFCATRNEGNKETEYRNGCMCDLCECLDCQRISLTPNTGRRSKSQFHNTASVYHYSKDNDSYCNASGSIYPIQKENRVPPMFHRKLNFNNNLNRYGSINQNQINKEDHSYSKAYTNFDNTVTQETQRSVNKSKDNYDFKNIFESNKVHQRPTFFNEFPKKYAARNYNINETSNTNNILTIKKSSHETSFVVPENRSYRISTTTITNRNASASDRASIVDYITDLLTEVVHFSLNTVNFKPKKNLYKNGYIKKSQIFHDATKKPMSNTTIGSKSKFNDCDEIPCQSITIQDSVKQKFEKDNSKPLSRDLQEITDIQIVKISHSRNKLLESNLKLNEDENNRNIYSSKMQTNFFKNGGDINDDVAYERVKRTLQKAKEFSVKLTKVLEHYEKANKEHKNSME